MKYVRLGKTGVLVSAIALGTMTFGERDTWKLGGVPVEEASKMIGMAYDAGVNLFDTADVYDGGRAEEILGESVKHFRNEVLIATKVRGKTGNGINDQGLSRYHIKRAIKESLRRLGTDRIDLYQFHGWDAITPVEESASAMQSLVDEDLVVYPGISNFSAWQIATLQSLAMARGYTPYVSAQMNYSLLNRDIEHEVLPYLNYAQMSLLVWSPLQGGLLSGKYTDLNSPPRGTRLGDTGRIFPYFEKEQYPGILEKINSIARDQGATAAQVSIAWLLSKGSIVIIGARTKEQLEENLNAVNVSLKPSQIKELDEVSAQRIMYPNWMIENQNSDRKPAV
jgi:aryl-alcohol dehydrogenase-like predicted oxidoreductase